MAVDGGTRGRLTHGFGTVLLTVLLTACGGEGGPSSPDDDPSPTRLEVAAPAEVIDGRDFELGVRAVTSDGSTDDDVSGTVTLGASAGSISPSTLELVDGTASVTARVTGAAGSTVTLRARWREVSGTASTRVVPPVFAIESVTPAVGPPTTIIEISGVEASDLDLDDAHVSMGGLESVLRAVEDGGLFTVVPIDPGDGSSWPEPAADPLDVAVVDAATGDTLAFGESLFTMTELPEAPGTARQIESDLATAIDALAEVGMSFGEDPSVQHWWTSGITAGLDWLVNGADTLALAGALDHLEEEEPRLLEIYDALLALTAVDDWAAGLAEWSETAAEWRETSTSSGTRGLAAAGPARAGGVVSDEELASQMQMYVTIKEFGDSFLSPTAGDFALAMALTGLGKAKLAISLTVGLAMSEFLVNNYLVAAYPSKIDDFTLDIPKDTIRFTEKTAAEMILTASNQPPVVTVEEWINIGLAWLGPLASGSEVEELLNLALGIVLSKLKDYNETQQTDFVLSLGEMPPITWEARITDDRFVRLHSDRHMAIDTVPYGVQWEAIGLEWGEAEVWAETSTETNSIVVPQPPGFAYDAQSFGYASAITDRTSVWAQPLLVMEVDVPDQVDEVTFAPLVVRAGYDTSAGTEWSSGIEIEMAADGGMVETAQGNTDDNGEFHTAVKLDPGSHQVRLSAAGSGDVGSRDTVTAIGGAVCPPDQPDDWFLTDTAWAEGGATAEVLRNDFVDYAVRADVGTDGEGMAEVEWRDYVYVQPADPARMGENARADVRLTRKVWARKVGSNPSAVAQLRAGTWGENVSTAEPDLLADTVVTWNVKLGGWQRVNGLARAQVWDGIGGTSASARVELTIEDIHIREHEALGGAAIPVITLCSASGTEYPLEGG